MKAFQGKSNESHRDTRDTHGGVRFSGHPRVLLVAIIVMLLALVAAVTLALLHKSGPKPGSPAPSSMAGDVATCPDIPLRPNGSPGCAVHGPAPSR